MENDLSSTSTQNKQLSLMTDLGWDSSCRLVEEAFRISDLDLLPVRWICFCVCSIFHFQCSFIFAMPWFLCDLVVFVGMREPSDAFPPFTTAGPTYVNPTFSPGLRRTRMENAIVSTSTNQRPGDWRSAGQFMYEKPELGMLFGPCHNGGTVESVGFCFLNLFLFIEICFRILFMYFSFSRKNGWIKPTRWYLR